MLGNIQLENFSPCKLPQKAASAWSAVMEKLVGVHFDPLLYLGSQLVNGNNFHFIAERRTIAANPQRNVVLIGINKSLTGEYTIIKPIQILA